MISVDLNMDQYGLGKNVYGLARIVIWNEGTGSAGYGNYCFAVSHQFNSPMGEEAKARTKIKEPTAMQLVNGGPWVWKSGSIKNYPRRLGAVRLLGRCLTQAKLK